MTPEEVKKRFEKAIEAMFASASRQLGDIENKTPDVIDSLHLMGSAMEGIAFDDGVIRSFSELLEKFKDAQEGRPRHGPCHGGARFDQHCRVDG